MLEIEALDPFVADGLVTEVESVVKSGKEATVYRCRGTRGPVAAKVYKALQHRAFKNNAEYRAGDRILDVRAARAVSTKTRFGQQAQQTLWVGREYEHLVRLHAAGAHVPRPLAVSDGAILMEYLGDEDGPAPTLRQVRLEPAQAARALDWLLYNVELMLANDLVHGDLSPYNVLWWDGWATIIDLPQAVDPRFNRNARALLERDVRTLCAHFARQGVPRAPEPIVGDLWRRFLRAEL